MKKRRIISVDPGLPVYTISVVSEIVHIPIWTLRQLDEKDICCPKRTKGKTRLYSHNDLVLLKRIQELMEDEGINMNGIRYMLEQIIEEIDF